MIAALISFIASGLIWLIIIYSLLTFLTPPHNSFRQDVERLISPLLDPIRRRIPATGMYDFSPLALILIIYVVEAILVGLFR